MRYIHKSSKVQVTGGGAAANVTLGVTQKDPVEGVTICVRLFPASLTGKNVDVTPTLDGLDVTAKKLSTIATGVPQFITLDGIIPPGLNIGAKVENKDASGKVSVQIDIMARSYGPVGD